MLSSADERFLTAVSWVCELDKWDTALAFVGRRLWVQLGSAEDKGLLDVVDRTQTQLGRIGEMRGKIARELATLRSREPLQILS